MLRSSNIEHLCDGELKPLDPLTPARVTVPQNQWCALTGSGTSWRRHTPDLCLLCTQKGLDRFSACTATREDTWRRARGWALVLGLAYLASSRDDEAMGALGLAVIDAALHDVS
jgi:hypothetical protein